ncbi:helix-turn-helix domain-containing protein [Pedobacter insulae]|uniref:Helix-turn-helix domain-containing protein n=1 Tax=Pedobacter insulae TaxID=414048 RepID=A0A1I2ZDP5_9SPHI|nr:helix-turn-helix domain-containing protein [Pedobacter insulae]SFH35977.1 Helix-turn-helix domain-containing protein [Pedobacter insulae]
MDYQTFEPSNLVNSFVKCYWTLDIEKQDPPEKQRIVPDGCMEMIFHLGDHYIQYQSNGQTIEQPNCFVFGQITKPLEIEPAGITSIFAVRFHPDGFTSFATLPLKQMENKAVSISELFGNEGLELQLKVVNALTTQKRITIIEDFLMSRLLAPELVDRMIKSSVKTILKLKGQLSVSELSEKANINRRQLERRFADTIGLSPKQLAKIIRIQVTLNTMLNRDFESLTSLAYKNDYFDQAHFIKDFKEFTGVNPKKFYSDNLKMSSLFSKPTS